MKQILLLIMLSTVASPIFSQKPVPLYQGTIPRSKVPPAGFDEQMDANDFASHVSVPTITPYLPAKSNATDIAIIIFPGGGYSGLSMTNEGSSVARAFADHGITAFVVKYRLPDDRIMINKECGPLQDAQQAIWYVRKHAAQWGLDPSKTGIIGFSAGGHLASTAGTHFDKNLIGSRDSISLVPSFMLLLYPVISFGPYAHTGSKKNLLGRNADSTIARRFSNETRVTSATPPTLVIHAADDDVVDVQNSLEFFKALQSAHIPSELHVYERGGHGFGLNNPTTTDKWLDRCLAWLQTRYRRI